MTTLQTPICLLFSLSLLASCENDRLKVDVSAVEAEVKIGALDETWPTMTPVSFRKLHPQYVQEFGPLYKHYIEDVLQLGNVDDSNLFAAIHEFVTHPDFEQVFVEVETVYGNKEALVAEIENAWKHYRYYFPDSTVPNHITCVCGFNNPFVITENGVGICLEMFLGQDCRFYQYLQTPLYLRKRMTQKHLVPWMMKAWMETEYSPKSAQPSLLENIIFSGKVLYALDAFFPEAPDSIKIGYTTAQMQWAQEHEKLVWAHFIDNDLLFETKPVFAKKYTTDGPFTVDFVKESPSRMGGYVGWQIVRSYMEKQETVDLRALMEMDATMILNQSNYNP